MADNKSVSFSDSVKSYKDFSTVPEANRIAFAKDHYYTNINPTIPEADRPAAYDAFMRQADALFQTIPEIKQHKSASYGETLKGVASQAPDLLKKSAFDVLAQIAESGTPENRAAAEAKFNASPNIAPSDKGFLESLKSLAPAVVDALGLYGAYAATPVSSALRALNPDAATILRDKAREISGKINDERVNTDEGSLARGLQNVGESVIPMGVGIGLGALTSGSITGAARREAFKEALKSGETKAVAKSIAELAKQETQTQARKIGGKVALTAMAAPAGSAEFSQLREEGKTPLEATAPAMGYKYAEKLGESLPTQAIFDPIKSGIVKRFGKIAIPDYAGESITQQAQDEIDYQLAAKDAQSKGLPIPERDWSQRFKNSNYAGTLGMAQSGIVALPSEMLARQANDVNNIVNPNAPIDPNTPNIAPSDSLQSTGGSRIAAALAKSKQTAAESAVSNVADAKIEDVAVGALQNKAVDALRNIANQSNNAPLQLGYTPTATEVSNNKITLSDGSVYNQNNDTLIKNGTVHVRGLNERNAIVWQDTGQPEPVPAAVPSGSYLRDTLANQSISEFMAKPPQQRLRELDLAKQESNANEQKYLNDKLARLATEKSLQAEIAAQNESIAKQQSIADLAARQEKIVSNIPQNIPAGNIPVNSFADLANTPISNYRAGANALRERQRESKRQAELTKRNAKAQAQDASLKAYQEQERQAAEADYINNKNANEKNVADIPQVPDNKQVAIVENQPAASANDINVATKQESTPAPLYKDPNKVTRGVSNRKNRVRSLVEFIADRGGIIDTGGELAQMGADAWHKEAPMRKKLLRDADTATGNMFGKGETSPYSPDEVTLAAWEAGYMPQFTERPTYNDLLELADKELARKNPVYRPQDIQRIQAKDEKMTKAQAKSQQEDWQSQREGEVLLDAARKNIETEGRALDDIEFDANIADDIIYAENADENNKDDVVKQLAEDYAAEIELMKQEGYLYDTTENLGGNNASIETTKPNSKSASSSGKNETSANDGIKEVITEKTAAGTQTVIAGAEKISDKKLAERKMAEKKRAKVTQKDAGSDGGLFDVGARDQIDMFDKNKMSVSNEKLGTTSQVVTDAIKKRFGKTADKLLDSGRVTIVQSISDLPELKAGLYRQDAAGVFSPNGKSYLIADNLSDGNHAVSVFIHEIGVHAGMRQILGNKVFNDVLRSVQNLKGAAAVEARNAVPSDTPSEYVAEEQLAYLVEYAPDLPLVKRVISSVKAFAYRMSGGKIDFMTDADFRNMAIAAIRGLSKREGELFYRDSKDIAYSITQKERTQAKVPTKRALVAFAKKWGTVHRGAGKSVLDLKITRDGIINAHDVDIENMNNNFTKAMRSEYGKEEPVELFHQYMTAKPEDKAKIDIKPETRKALDVMRAYVDSVSGSLVNLWMDTLERRLSKLSKEVQDSAYKYMDTDGKEGVMPDSLVPLWGTIIKVEGNKGSYLNRSYEAFDNKDWKKIALGNKKIMDDARAYFSAEYPNKTPDEIDGVIGNILQEAKDAGDMIGLVYRGGKYGSKDTSFLKKKKDISWQVRQLLGEYTDPRLTVSRSVSKMVNHIAGHKFLHAVYDVGLGDFLHETQKGIYDTQYASDSSNTLDPLNGMYTTPEFVQAMRDLNDIGTESDLERRTIGFMARVNYGLTILNPGTHVGNFLSNIGFLIGSAHSPMAIKKSIKVLAQDNEASRIYHKMLTTIGVLHESIHSQELRRVFNEANATGTIDKKSIMGIIRKTRKGIENAYDIEDSFWKIVAFEAETKRQMKYKKLGLDKARTIAADVVRKTYPTYSLTPMAIQQLRRVPFGSFATFPYHAGRFAVNSLKIIGDEFANGSKVIAIQRTLGLAAAMTLPEIARVMSMAAFGMDDDDDKATRRASASWVKNALLVYLGYDENGLMNYIDVSKFDPFTFLKKPLYAVVRGTDEDVSDNIKSALGEIAAPFISLKAGVTTLIDIAANKNRRSGKPIYNEFDDESEKIKLIADYASKSVSPGVVKSTMRVIDAMDGYDAKGRPADLGNEIAGWFGFRKTAMNIPLSLKYSGYEFRDKNDSAQSKIKPMLFDADNITEDDMREALADANKKRESSFKEMNISAKAALKLGVPEKIVRQSIKMAGISEENIDAIMDGRYIPYKEQDIAFKNALDGMRQEAVSKEKFAEIEKRYKERRTILRKLINESKIGKQSNLKSILNEANKLSDNSDFQRFMATTGALNKRNTSVYSNILNGVG